MSEFLLVDGVDGGDSSSEGNCKLFFALDAIDWKGLSFGFSGGLGWLADSLFD